MAWCGVVWQGIIWHDETRKHQPHRETIHTACYVVILSVCMQLSRKLGTYVRRYVRIHACVHVFVPVTFWSVWLAPDVSGESPDDSDQMRSGS